MLTEQEVEIILHPEYKQWITEDGEFEILVASSAADIHDSLIVTLESTLKAALCA